MTTTAQDAPTEQLPVIVHDLLPFDAQPIVADFGLFERPSQRGYVGRHRKAKR